jgi:hypothetical protein
MAVDIWVWLASSPAAGRYIAIRGEHGGFYFP